MLEEEEADS